MSGGVGPFADEVEREVKLDVPETFTVPDLSGLSGAAAGLTVTELAPLDLDAVYFDTTDGRLADQGVSLRRREGEGTRWTAKFPTVIEVPGGGVARREVELILDDEQIPEVLAGLVEPFLAGAPADPVARLRSRRRRLALAGPDERPLAELDDDSVTAEGPSGATATFREIELEFGPDAPAPVIEAVVAALVGAGARPGSGQSKVQRALSLLGRG